ncbi:protein SFI1 homolog isoform X2 [Nematostella vectensis]|uniref:protein SFI1 homolog isoform X2 n=1 Tax=Nematostella vectensis TaxID=45351 RepID=UPI0020770B3A|nr:protein SFI1 homolog isoform X2 [Nematostella vectensis]
MPQTSPVKGSDRQPTNNRYGAVSKPKLLSLQSAKKKAENYAAKNDKKARVGAKKAVLQELNTHLAIRAQGLQLKLHDDRGENPYSVGKIVKDKRKPPVAKHKTVRKTEEIVTDEVVQEKVKAKPSGYDWDMHGRQAEHRIRYLARKYLMLWQKHTYGQITPSLARLHYHKSLQRQVLKVWQDIWWASRKGWKLNIRADYHNRYRIWQRTFKAWKLFVMLSRAKKTKIKLASQYAEGKLTETCIKAWKQYISSRRFKKVQCKIAERHSNTLIMRRAWQQWGHQMSIKYELSIMETQAMQFWAWNLMQKGWSVWAAAYCTRQKEKSKLAAAEGYFNKRLMSHTWVAWKSYRASKRLSNLQKRVADRHFYNRTLQQAFKAWTSRWHRQNELAQFEEIISSRGAAASMRRSFIHWKFYVWLQHRKYEKEELATAHYRKHLLSTGLSCFQLQVVERRLKIMRDRMAKEACYKLTLRRAWIVWLKRCEHSEELKLYVLTRTARTHYSLGLLRVSLHGWVRYCQWRRHRRAQYLTADLHYGQVALPRFFLRLRVFVDLMHEKREDNHAAAKFRREVLFAQTFYKWLELYRLQQDVRMLNRMAILHYDEVLKSRFIKYWAGQAREKLRLNRLEDIAISHCNHKRMEKALCHWRNFVRDTKDSRSSQHTAVKHYYISLLKWTWSAWVKFTERKRVKWRKRAVADLHYSNRVLSLTLQAWKVYRVRCVQAQTTADERYREYNKLVLRESFESWREHAVEHKANRRAHHLAKKTWKRRLLSKVLIAWHVYAIEHSVKAEEMRARVQETKKALDRGKLRRALRAWTLYSQHSVVQRSLHHSSVSHHNKVVLRKALDAWKAYTKLCFRVQILNRQSMWLHNRRILSYHFARLKSRYSESMALKRKSTLALWHWSVALQRRAFFALLEYAIAKKHKKSRIEHALRERRSKLLRDGVTRWMQVVHHLACLRSRYAQARHLEAARGVQECVYRCAMHWRRWASERARRRPASPRPRPVEYLKEKQGLREKPVPGIRETETNKGQVAMKLDLFRTRPRPRVPDYLRESYDLPSITIETDKRPIPAVNTSETPRDPNDKQEDIPRSSPPRPSPRPQLATSPSREESIVFPPSSEGEGESFLSTKSFPPRYRSKEESNSTVPSLRPFPGDEPHSAANALMPPAREVLRISAVNSTAIPRSKCPSSNPVLLPPSTFVPKKRTTPIKKGRPTNNPCIRGYGRQSLSDSESPEDVHSDVSSSEEEVDKGMDITILQSRILGARDKLQEYQALKLKHRDTVRQRDELDDVIRQQASDPEALETLRDAQALLDELNNEIDTLTRKLKEERPHMEQLAAHINELVSGANKPSC